MNNLNKKLKISHMGFFFLVCMIIYSVVCVTPLLQNSLNKIYYAACVSLTALSILFYSVYLKVNQSKTFLFYILVFLQISLYRAIDYSSCSWNFVLVYGITYLSFFIPPLFLTNKPDSFKIAKIFIYTFLIIVFINVIDNIRLLLLYPGASEAINFEYGEEYKSMNVGGSGFVYLVMFVGLFIMLVIQTQKRYHILLWFLFVLSFVYILMSGRAIGVITFFVGSVLLMLYGNNDTKKNRLLLFIVFFIICSVVILNIDFISQILELYLESDRLSSRLEEAASFGQSENSSGSGLGRISLYLLSIKTFLSSPQCFLFGVGDAVAEGSMMYKKGIGMHSAFFDFAAKYGVICFFSYYMLFRITYLNTYKKIKNIYPSCKIIFFLFIISAFINNVVSPAILFLVFIIVPSYIMIIGNSRDVSNRL